MIITVVNNKDIGGKEFNSIIKDNEFVLPDETELVRLGFRSKEIINEQDDENFVLGEFCIASKQINGSYVKYMADVEQVSTKGKEFRDFREYLLSVNIDTVKPIVRKIIVAQHKTDSMMLIGTQNYHLIESMADYFPNITPFWEGAINLIDMYVTPPIGWSYNNNMQLYDNLTGGVISLKKYNLLDVMDRLKNEHSLLTIGFNTDIDVRVVISRDGTIRAPFTQLNLDARGLGLGVFSYIADIADTLISYVSASDKVNASEVEPDYRSSNIDDSIGVSNDL
jgi:hypothetical protein